MPQYKATQVAAMDGQQTIQQTDEYGNTKVVGPDGAALPSGALIGAVNETAPATDTASSGLNGRLQRIAQRITSLIALFPIALGQGTMAQSLRVVLPSDQTILPVGGNVSPGNAATGNPLLIGFQARTALALQATDTGVVRTVGTTAGAMVVQPYAPPEVNWSYAAAANGIVNTTTAVTIKSAAGTGLRNYITSIDITAEALGAATEVAIRDGATGTVLWRTKIGTGGLINGLSISFSSPLRGTADTLLEFVTLTASVTGAVYFNAQGYVAP